MPTPGFGFIVVGVLVAIFGLIISQGCTGELLLFFGAASILIGSGLALSGGVPALFFLGPLGVFLLVAGFFLRATGHC
jgi:hypothetical protein